MPHRSIVQLSPPAVEPVTITQAKGQLGLMAEQTDDDALILRLIATGRRLVEQRLGVTLATRQFRATFVEGSGEVAIPLPPLLVDADHPLAVTWGGVLLDPSLYTVDADSRPGVVRFASWPGVSTIMPLVVTFWAGPAPGSRIEPGLESAVLMYVAHGYRNRESTTVDGVRELPMGFETLLAAHSVTGAW